MITISDSGSRVLPMDRAGHFKFRAKMLSCDLSNSDLLSVPDDRLIFRS